MLLVLYGIGHAGNASDIINEATSIFRAKSTVIVLIAIMDFDQWYLSKLQLITLHYDCVLVNRLNHAVAKFLMTILSGNCPVRTKF